MILLDTNVVSEPMRPAPDARVAEWIDSQPTETLWLSAMTVAELRAGVALLPAGKRRTVLHESLEQRILPLFEGRVLAFDMACTNVYAQLTAKARATGKAVETADACIAATALAYGYVVATRNTMPFEAAGVKVIDPWKMKPA
jgi:predicted nucleic acid-binding protein